MFRVIAHAAARACNTFPSVEHPGQGVGVGVLGRVFESFGSCRATTWATSFRGQAAHAPLAVVRVGLLPRHRAVRHLEVRREVQSTCGHGKWMADAVYSEGVSSTTHRRTGWRRAS